MKNETVIPIPGAGCSLAIERDDDGRLLSITAAGRVYLRLEDGRRIYDDGFVTAGEVEAPSGLLRHVRAGTESWVESYLRDAAGLPVRIDGVEIRRDERGRVVACDGPDGNWRYHYSGDFLSAVISPSGTRRIERDLEGRPVAVEEQGVCRRISYRAGLRADTGEAPSGWNRDDDGRLWTVSGPGGVIESFYIWDGFNCLGRVDGPPGEPLAAVFSLDGTGTPVRIITRSGVTRVPRDAFGESLLAYPGVPGLFGGARHDEFFHYSARALDPRLGSYNAPDPWHGGADDPRRAEGYRGTLVVERPVAGSYAVCQYDPVAYVDPTGTIAWYYLLSTLTWAFPNNLLTWVGIEGTINFWGSLLSGKIGEFFSGEHISSERFGIGAMQLQGVMAAEGQVFTTQHIVWAKRDHFEEHADASGFVPDVAIIPTYYGTMLRLVPQSGAPFLLRGSVPGIPGGTPMWVRPNNPPPAGTIRSYLGWTRSGGEGAAFAPGLLVPHFPEGGFHFAIQSGLHAPMPGVITELEPGGGVATGTVDNELLLAVAATGLGIADGELVLVTNVPNVADILPTLSVEETGSLTQIRFDGTALASGTAGLLLRRLGARQSSELLPRGAQNTHLNVTSANAPYAANDALRLLDGANPAGAAIVTGFEAQLAIDARLPGTLSTPLSVFALSASGPQRGGELTADANVLTFPNDPVPAVGDFILVSRGGTTIAVALVPGGTGRDRRAERSLAGLGAAGPVSWQSLVRGSTHGIKRDAVELGAQLTYAPIVRGTAPANGFVGVEDGGGNLAARAVSAATYDVLVLASPLPAGPAQFTVERYQPQGTGTAVASVTTAAVLALSQSVTFTGVALRLLQLGAPAAGPGVPAAGSIGASVSTGFTVAGQTATMTFRAPLGATVNVSDAVVIRGGTPEIGVVTRIEMTLEMDRDLTLAADNLRLVPLLLDGPVYAAEQLGPRSVAVAPTVGGVRVQMPRFFTGEIVRVSGGGGLDRLFRIAGVAGTTLTLEGDADIPAAAGALSVQRMAPDDPGTGGPFAGINGTPVHPNTGATTRYARFRFWSSNATGALDRVGIVSNGVTLPARVRPTRYDATQPSAATPMQLDVGATVGGVAVAAPQFQIGDVVFIEWTAGGSNSGEFDVTAVAGARIDVAPRPGGTAIAGAATAITVRRIPRIDITFAAAPAASGAGVEILLLVIASQDFVAAFNQESPNAVTVPGMLPAVTVPSPNMVVVVSYTETPVHAAGQLTSGTVKPPDDPENWEFDRRQALVEHELRHSQQYNWFGPLWFTLFPVWILDTVMDAATDVDLPAYSAFVPATLTGTDTDVVRRLEIPDMHGVDFERGNTVQLYRGSTHNEVELGTREGNRFDISGSLTLGNGEVFVRRRASGQGSAYDVIFGILRALTPASLMNMTMTLTYGSVYQLIGRIIHLISRAVDHGTLLDATVENEGAVAVLATPSQVSHLRNESRVIVRVENGKVVRSISGAIVGKRITLDAPVMISSGRDVKVSREGGNQQADAELKSSGTALELKELSSASLFDGATRIEITISGDTTVVRSIEPPGDDGRITFRAPLPVTSGTVKVAPYETMTPGTYWHWNSYYPATVDPERLASVTLHADGSDSLTLRPRDRVRVLYDENDGFGFTTTVTAVDGDKVDLEQAFPNLPSNNGAEMIVRLSKIGRDDPTGWLDQRLVDDLYDAGWVRWITDPFGQIHYTVQQRDRGSFWDHFSRVGRYLLGTSAWSLMPPAFGYYFWDGLFLARAKDAPYLAFIEQDASEHSGDLYTSIGRLYGEGARSVSDDSPAATMTVGDIALYWFWPGDRFVIIPNGSMQDAPGVLIPDELCAMPFVTAESGPAAPGNGNEPNNNAEAGAAATAPGSAVPDVFFDKSPADPREPNATAPRCFDVSMRGHVPMEAGIQRTMANYVAFTRPTTGTERHRMTIRGGLNGGVNSDRHAQDEGKQVLFYNITVVDVTTRVNGITIPEGGTARLLVTQRVRVDVTSDGGESMARRYRATVRRPADGPVLRAPEELVLQAGAATGAGEPVEISRFYHYDTVAREYESGAIRGRGVHMPTDIDIPVRELAVDVVDTLPVTAALPADPNFDIYNGPIAPLRPGSEVFVLVPSSVILFNRAVEYASPPPPLATVDPTIPLTDAADTASAALMRFLGLGRPFRLRLEGDDIPEERAVVRFDVTVGEPGNQAALTVRIPIEGHFLANDPGNTYQVARGNTLQLNCADLAGAAVTPLDTVQVTRLDGTPPPLVGADLELTFSVAGSQLTITANAAATVGRRRLLVTSASDATLRARRTVEIV